MTTSNEKKRFMPFSITVWWLPAVKPEQFAYSGADIIVNGWKYGVAKKYSKPYPGPTDAAVEAVKMLVDGLDKIITDARERGPGKAS